MFARSSQFLRIVALQALLMPAGCSSDSAVGSGGSSGGSGSATGGVGNASGGKVGLPQNTSGGSTGTVGSGGANSTGTGAMSASGGAKATGGNATGGVIAAGGGGGRDFSTNRASFFGASRCAGANVQFCEDFESGTLDAATWQKNGTPVIDELLAARGTKALHISRDGNGSQSIKLTKVFPAMNGRYFGRAFVYLNAMPHNSAAADSLDYAHWTIIAATGSVVDGEVRIGGQLQKRYNNATPFNFWGVGTDNRNQPEGTGDWTNADNDPMGAAQPVEEKKWLCLEWMGDTTTDETKFYLDGVEHPSLATTPTTPHGGNPTKPFLLPEFNAIWFGWAEYQATTQKFELWFDEIAIDHERIGCAL